MGQRQPSTTLATALLQRAGAAYVPTGFGSRLLNAVGEGGLVRGVRRVVAAALAKATRCRVDAIQVAAAKQLKADELITAERSGRPLHKVRGV